MAMVNSVVSPPIFNPNVKDSRWLTLEVCREYQRNKCTRSDQECKFAHPPPHVEVQNGRVTCCFDSIKGKCQRKEPPCKYLHPPQHLKEQLLQNGRNNLILKNLQMQAMAASLPIMPNAGVFPMVYEQSGGSPKPVFPSSPVMPAGHYPMVVSIDEALKWQSPQHLLQASPYVMQNSVNYNPNALYQLPQGMNAGMLPAVDASGASVPVSAAAANANAVQVQGGVVQNASNHQKMQRADRLEPTSSASPVTNGCGSWAGAPLHSEHPSVVASSSHPYQPLYLQNIAGMPGMMPMMKRTAMADKGGMPVYSPSTHYHQAALAAMQLQHQQQQFGVPSVTIAGHPPSMPRF